MDNGNLSDYSKQSGLNRSIIYTPEPLLQRRICISEMIKMGYSLEQLAYIFSIDKKYIAISIERYNAPESSVQNKNSIAKNSTDKQITEYFLDRYPKSSWKHILSETIGTADNERFFVANHLLGQGWGLKNVEEFVGISIYMLNKNCPNSVAKQKKEGAHPLKYKTEVLAQEMREKRRKGVSITQMAREYGISRRSVYNYIGAYGNLEDDMKIDKATLCEIMKAANSKKFDQKVFQESLYQFLWDSLPSAEKVAAELGVNIETVKKYWPDRFEKAQK